MKTLTWIFRIVILIAAIFLAVQNSEMTRFTIFDNITIDLPLIALLFVFLALGMIFGLLLIVPKYLSLKWSTRKLIKEVETHKTQIEKMTATTPVNTSVDVPMIM